MPSPAFTKISAEHGQVDAHSPLALKEAGNDAVRAGDMQRAVHMFTLGLDLLLGSSSDVPKEAQEWYALDVSSKGVLHALCSNRSFAYLTLKDAAAAAEDAENCCLARPDFAKGHLRLLAALAALDAPVSDRRDACARGLRACPNSRDLQEAKAALHDVETEEEAAEAVAARIAATKLIADNPEECAC